MKKIEKNLMEGFWEYNVLPPLILSKDFFDSNSKTFIVEYEAELIKYIEWERSLDRIESDNIVDQEYIYIEETAKYLIRKNEINLKVRREKFQALIDTFVAKRKISKELVLSILEKENLTESDDEILTAFDDFGSKFKDDAKIKTINIEVEAFNEKMHYLSLRARGLGFNTNFSEGVQFNEIKKEQTEEFLELSSKRVMDSARAKFIMLNELGIVDFLQDKLGYLPSESKLAKILSDITGEHQQHCLNGYKNKESRNNPYREPKEGRENPVEIVKNRLRGYGVQLDE